MIPFSGMLVSCSWVRRRHVARIGKEMARLFSSLPTDEKTLIARRAAEVRTMWKDAIEYVYKENAPYVLDHVNAVYIKEEEGIRSLYVYMDDGNFRSDVHCETKSESSRSVPLSPEEKTEVEQMVSSVENPSLRRALEKAMITDREWKKGERS